MKTMPVVLTVDVPVRLVNVAYKKLKGPGKEPRVSKEDAAPIAALLHLLKTHKVDPGLILDTIRCHENFDYALVSGGYIRPPESELVSSEQASA